MRVHAISCLLSALGFCVPIQAVLAQARDTSKLEDLVVTATRTPKPARVIGSSVDRLDPEELRRHQRVTVREALELMPGGTVLTTGAPGGVTSLFLRGVASTQTLFLIDGIRVNDADAGFATLLGGLEVSGLDGIEIVRGPQSTLYGGAAIGGVVAMQAAAGRGRPHGEAELDGGSFATWRGRISGAGSRGRIGVAATFTANGTDNQRHPNDWDQRTELIRVDYTGNFWRAGGTFRSVQSEYTNPGDLRTTNTTPEGTNTFRNNLETIWAAVDPWPNVRSKLTAGLQQQHNKTSSRFNGGDEFLFTMRNYRRVLDWQSSVAPARQVTLLAGLDREWSTAKTDDGELDQRLLAVYAEAQLNPVEPLHLTAGVRADNYNTFGHATTYRFTGAWEVKATATTLRASIGSGFMPPSLTARFGSVFQNPNPEIRPEHSRGWDIGAEQELPGGRGRIAVSWFHNHLKDLIGFESAPFPALGRSVNIDRARTEGLEVSSRLRVGILDARTAYTLLSATSPSEPDPALRRLIRRPRHTVSADAVFALPKRASVGGGFVALLDREDTDFNTFPSQRVDPGNYLVARLYGSWELGRLTFQARVENLFDEQYEPVYGFPALGRSLSGSARVRF